MKITKKQAVVAGTLLVPGGAIALGIYWLLTKCWHKYTRPITIRVKGRHVTYVVCTECGKEFKYDLNTMQVGEELPNGWHRTGITKS